MTEPRTVATDDIQMTNITRNDNNQSNGTNSNEYENNYKIFGCIPQQIHGNFGCICKPLKCIRYSFNPIVSITSVIIIWSFVFWCAFDTDNASYVMNKANQFVIRYFGWFYIVAVAIFGFFSIYLFFSKYGDIKLGPKDEPPKYPLITWFSMLFSAGLGSGLYFFGVAEPVWHLTDMQNGDNKYYYLTTNRQAMEALNIAWFGWGFAPSACYVVAALPLAYHHHILNEPLRESSCFIALIGKKYSQGFIGSIIDLSSIISTMFGIAVSLGVGCLSINSGLEYTLGIKQNLTNKLIIIWVITIFATISVLTGLDKGIRRLSEINFGFSFIIMIFVFWSLDPIYLINLFIQAIGYHFQWLLQLTFDTQAFQQAGFFNETESNNTQTTWMQHYTIFYWAWWIAWAPFVGTFIAQISKGRTIREFVMGNMIVPTLIVFIWVAIFGGIGLYNELGSIQNGIECGDNSDDATLSSIPHEWYSEFDGNKILKLSCFKNGADIFFASLTTLPLTMFMSILSMIGIIMYFVTSSDSASHVVDILTAGGIEEPPKLQRIFWALTEGAVASMLLATSNESNGSDNASGLTALEAATLIAALPFTMVLICECMATYKTLLIHTGELKPKQQIYWKYDLFECAGKFVFGLLCPPYFQTRARLNIIGYIEKNNDENNMYGIGISRISKCIWIGGYWLLWALFIIFLCLEFIVNGFFYLGLTMYCFYYVISVMNRNVIKTYYNINSSHIIFDFFSWGFCCCCAVIQEDLQSIQDVDYDLSVKLKLKKSISKVADETESESQNAETMSFLKPPVDITDTTKRDVHL
eukprot:546811_1